MDLTFLLGDKKMTIYECSKKSGIPYSTLSDIVHGKTPMQKVNFRTAYYLAATLDISMEELYDKTVAPERQNQETFKSQIRHDLKSLGDAAFIKKTVKSDIITRYWHFGWFFESLYLLAMLDYLCRINHIKKVDKYDPIREYKLPEIVYPSDILLGSALSSESELYEEAIKKSIPEFMSFNIVENDVRDVY